MEDSWSVLPAVCRGHCGGTLGPGAAVLASPAGVTHLGFWCVGCCLMAMYCVSSCSRLSGESGFRRMP